MDLDVLVAAPPDAAALPDVALPDVALLGAALLGAAVGTVVRNALVAFRAWVPGAVRGETHAAVPAVALRNEAFLQRGGAALRGVQFPSDVACIRAGWNRADSLRADCCRRQTYKDDSGVRCDPRLVAPSCAA